MLTFGASQMCCSTLTAGMTYGPIAAGVRSISVLPGRRAGTRRDARVRRPTVASNTMLDVVEARQLDEPVDARRRGGDAHALRARKPSDAGRCPTNAPISQYVRRAQDLDHQVGADIAGADDRALILRHTVLTLEGA